MSKKIYPPEGLKLKDMGKDQFEELLHEYIKVSVNKIERDLIGNINYEQNYFFDSIDGDKPDFLSGELGNLSGLLGKLSEENIEWNKVLYDLKYIKILIL